jgi:hypothetical protein
MVYEFFYVDDVTNSDGEWEGLWNWEWYFWDGTFGYGMGFLDGWMDGWIWEMLIPRYCTRSMITTKEMKGK